MRLQMLKESKEFWSKVDHNGVDRNRSTSVDFGSSAQWAKIEKNSSI